MGCLFPHRGVTGVNSGRTFLISLVILMIDIRLLLNSVKNHLRELTDELGSEDSFDLLGYLQAKSRLGALLSGEKEGLTGLPFWYHLPGWLANYYASTSDSYREEVPLDFVQDVLWAQYCIYCYIRIQDDVCDGQLNKPSYLFYGNRFLIETQKILTRHFTISDQLWVLYHELLVRTSMGILAGEAKQLNPDSPPEELLTNYCEAGAIFNLGAAATCYKYHRMDVYQSITEYTADMTIAGQIVDDILDVEEDLRNGKYNFATKMILRQGDIKEISPGNAAEVIGRNILYNGMDSVLQILQDKLEHAREIMHTLAIPEAVTMIRAYQQRMEQTKQAVHQMRVSVIFGREEQFTRWKEVLRMNTPWFD